VIEPGRGNWRPALGQESLGKSKRILEKGVRKQGRHAEPATNVKRSQD